MKITWAIMPHTSYYKQLTKGDQENISPCEETQHNYTSRDGFIPSFEAADIDYRRMQASGVDRLVNFGISNLCRTQ